MIVDTAWVRTYYGSLNQDNSANAIAIDSSGNVYVTGYSYLTDTSMCYDYATIKYFPNGDTAWVRGYIGPGNVCSEAKAIVVDYFGNVYITGYSGYAYATIKYYSNGDTAWIRKYSHAEAFDIAVDGFGNVYITGSGWGGYDISRLCHHKVLSQRRHCLGEEIQRTGKRGR